MIKLDDKNKFGFMDSDAPLTTAYDIWSAGILLYNIPFGEMPFDCFKYNETKQNEKYFGRLYKKIKCGKYTNKKWRKNNGNIYSVFVENKKLMDIISKCLHPIPNQRATAHSILCHQFLKNGIDFNKMYDTHHQSPNQSKLPSGSKHHKKTKKNKKHQVCDNGDEKEIENATVDTLTAANHNDHDEKQSEFVESATSTQSSNLSKTDNDNSDKTSESEFIDSKPVSMSDFIASQIRAGMRERDSKFGRSFDAGILSTSRGSTINGGNFNSYSSSKSYILGGSVDKYSKYKNGIYSHSQRASLKYDSFRW